jgi:pleiotropic regulator 1
MLPSDPQIITASEDSTIKLWDIRMGKTITTLTHHKKGIRSLIAHPRSRAFASGSSSSIKQWALPRGDFMQNLEGHESIINSLAINNDNVVFSGGDDGTMGFWDWKSGYKFQSTRTKPQPGTRRVDYRKFGE